MKAAWRDVTLGELFDISSSKRVLQKQWRRAGVPFYRAREIVKLSQHGSVDNELFISEELFESFRDRFGVPSAGDLMVSAVGTLGACYVVRPEDRFYFKDASVLRFSPREPVDPRFFQHAFRTRHLLDQVNAGSGSTVGTFTITRAKRTRLCIPPLVEQKRIAKILDAADALRAKRREALAQLDTLLQSTFVDMFGDPVTNPKGWPVEVLENWLENIDSGWSPKCLKRKALHDEWGVLKLGAVTWCQFDENEQKALLPDTAPRPEIEVTAGDLLFARKNTHQLVAAAAYVHEVRPRLMLPDLIFRLRLKPESRVEPKFLWQLLVQPHQRRTIQKLAGGAAGSMPNISKSRLRGVSLIRPPVDLQERFAAIVDSVEEQKTRQHAHLRELDTLFASLQSRAFRGDL